MIEVVESGQNALSVNGLTVEFPRGTGRVTVLNDVSFEVGAGECVALVGESGSGKTVTALSIMRLVEHGGGAISGGSISFNDGSKNLELTRLDAEAMRKIRGAGISMIFQDPLSSLNPAIRCGEQITEVILHHKKVSKAEAEAKALELLHEVGLTAGPDDLKKYPHEFSGGQRQRIMLATALAGDPKLLIADEPTTALDVFAKKKIIRLIKQIQRERGLSVIYITHDIDSIMDLAHRVVVMYSGKVVEAGLATEVFDNPIHPYTKGLLACRPPKTGHYYFLPTVDDFMRLSTDGTQILQSANLDEVYAALEQNPEVRKRQLTNIYKRAPLLRVSDFCKTYRSGVEALRHVSFDLYPGETLGLVGPSGCGKTTLARCLLGLTPTTSGSAAIKDPREDIYHPLPPIDKLGRYIQYVFQDPYSSFNPRKTIGQALTEPMRVQKIGDDKSRYATAISLLKKVGLKPGHMGRYPHEFSGGQLQRVAIARALVLEPQIIVCDEAVSALDASVQAIVLNLLNELKFEYGISYLFISHDLDVVRHMSDRIMVMKEGEIVEENDVDALFNQPSHPYTRELIT
ncbi:MAG: ABC transporter ATP-binding protein [Salibacteraceae bacterium]